MKTIVKTEEPSCLRVARENGWTWDDFHAKGQAGYRECREQALVEQKNECAYSGLWLGEGTTQNPHLDHFRKKVLYPELTFQWHNLFAAAKDKDYGADYKDKVLSGPRTSADTQYLNFLSPLEANLKEYFWYRQDGTIMAHPRFDERSDKELLDKIRKTIDIYNLNADDLKHKRKGVIENVRNLCQLDDDLVMECMATAGFSFVVDFELRQRADS